MRISQYCRLTKPSIAVKTKKPNGEFILAIRHTFATRALENGMNIKTLSEIIGHKNTSVTLNRYAHSMMDTKIEIMNKMSRIF